MTVHSLLGRDCLVLTPGRRLAYALRMSYAARAVAAGASVWRSPRVLPWSAWLRQQFLDHRASRSPSERRLLTAAQSLLLWEEIVTRSAAGQELLNPVSAARAAERSWQLLNDYLIDPVELERASSVEAQALSHWIQAYEQRCADLHAIDESRLAAWALQMQLVPPQPVVFMGFDALTPAIARLEARWRSQGLVLDVTVAAPVARDVVTTSVADAQAEIEFAARWALERVRSGDQSIAIVVPDLQTRRADVQRTFDSVFQARIESGATLHSALAVTVVAPDPLGDYPLVDAALSCLQLARGNRDSKLVGRILRSPFIGGGMTEHDLRALADVRLRDEQRDRWDWFELERWAGITGCAQLEMLARALNALLRMRPARAAANLWAEQFQRLLQALDWPGERALTSIEHQTMLKFQAVLAEFGALDGVLGSLTYAQAVARLSMLANDAAFEPESAPTPVVVIDPLTVSGMTFDALWLVGCEASSLPEPARPDPLLPLNLQRAARIPQASAAGALQRSIERLQRLIESAPRIVLSRPERAGDAELERSPLLQPWRHQPVDDLVSIDAKTLRVNIFEQRPVLERWNDVRAPRVAAGATGGGAMILELQSRCPFRAQAQLRLRAEPLATVGLGIEPKDRGTLIHRVLAAVWSELKAQSALIATPPAALAERVRAIAERHAASTLQPTTGYWTRLMEIEIDTVVSQVLTLLDIERRRPGFVVRFAEQGERFAIGGLQIRIQADRIDQLASGGEVLLDYKIGATSKPRDWLDTWPGRPRRPQMPLYALAHREHLSAVAFVILAPGVVEYRGWSDGVAVTPGIDPYPARLKLKNGEPATWPELLKHWERVLPELANAYAAGEAQVDPLPQECENCHLSTFCRIHERAVTSDPEESSDD